ncbi:signal peptidase II [Lachnospiraceae bacterium]|nr:signal peptidase II [Lachnospiraceae bacterium]
MNKKANSCIIFILSTICFIFLDQFTKYLALTHLKDGTSVILIPGVFQLHYLENRGAAFGMMQGMKHWFVIGTILLLGIIIVLYLRSPMEKKYKWTRFIMILVASGAIGNLIDRLRLDYVVDFFYFELINFPIFNVADIYVSCGTVLLIFLGLFYYKEEDFEKFFSFGKTQSKEEKI